MKENERQLIAKRPRRQCTLQPAQADPEVLGKVSAFVRFTGVECLFWDQLDGKGPQKGDLLLSIFLVLYLGFFVSLFYKHRKDTV